MAQAGIGRVVDGKYELIHEIGHGGMSVVWLGRDRRLEKLWAIKEIKPNVQGRQGEANRQAIIDEANFMKRLDHPAIPRVVDIIDTGTSVFVVMDYVNGTALSKLLKQQGTPFDQEDVVDWGIQLCDVLEYLHTDRSQNKNPIVYRDLKPANVMLRDDGSVKLIDFGISMELLPSGPSDTRVIGTEGYGAPEQVNKEIHKVVPVDARADIYALGATLYSLVTGHVPRRQSGSDGRQEVDFSMRPIRAWNARLSDGLERIIIKATQEDPNDRYQTAAEMRYDLEHYEQLTQEYRAAQQAKVDGFWRRVRISGFAAALGVACVAASFVIRNSSYETLMHEASVASTEERNVGQDANGNRVAEPSEAEQLYTRAIALDPGRLEAYDLVRRLYEDDYVFTTTEAHRWTSIWQEHGRQVAGNEGYRKLCYDVGQLYLNFYDPMDARGAGEDAGVVAATGGVAVGNVKQASKWFELAVDYGGQRVDENGAPRELSIEEAIEHRGPLSEEEVRTAMVMTKVARFYNEVAVANLKGEGDEQLYAAFWDTLANYLLTTGSNFIAGTESDKLPSDMLKMRIYQVAFEATSSHDNINGFMRAGKSQQDLEDMIEAAYDGALKVGEGSNNAQQVVYHEIVDNYGAARATIDRTYRNAASF